MTFQSPAERGEALPVRHYSFKGVPLAFTQVDGEWWNDATEAAAALGYTKRRALLRLFQRHAVEFGADETRVAKLTTTDGKAYNKRVFSPRGLRHLALLGRTPKCKAFRRWVLDVIDELQRARRPAPAIAQLRASMEATLQKKLDLALQTMRIDVETAALDTVRGLITDLMPRIVRRAGESARRDLFKIPTIAHIEYDVFHHGACIERLERIALVLLHRAMPKHDFKRCGCSMRVRDLLNDLYARPSCPDKDAAELPMRQFTPRKREFVTPGAPR